MPTTQPLNTEEQIKAIHNEIFKKLRDRIKTGELSLTATFKNEKTALHLIVTYPTHTALLQWILKNRPEIDIEAKSNTQCTPLIMAADVGNMHAVKLLIEYGANIEVKAANNEKARDVLVRKFPNQVSQFDQIVKEYKDKKNSNKPSLQSKKELLSNKTESFLGGFSFLNSFLSSSKRDDQAVPLIEKKTL